MARIRTVKPSYWTSEQVMNCSRDARLLFIGMWNFCDDRGVHPQTYRTLKAEIFPGDDDVTSADIERLTKELIAAELLGAFEHAGKPYLYVTGWSHQRIDRPSESRYPPPPATEPAAPDDPEATREPSPNPRRAIRERSSSVRRTLAEHSSSAPRGLALEGKGREGKNDVVGADDIAERPRSVEIAGPDGLRPPPANTTAVQDTGQDESQDKPAATKAPAVTADDVLAACQRIMPSARMRITTQSLRNVVGARLRDGTLPDLDTWEDYLRWCAGSAFLRGEGAANPTTGRPFRPDLVWLATQENYARIADGRYHTEDEHRRSRATLRAAKVA